MKKAFTSVALGVGLMAVLIPTAAFAAHRSPTRHGSVVFGTVCAYTAGQSVTISPSCGSSSDVTVNLAAHVRLDYQGSTSPQPDPAAGDSAAAFVWSSSSQTTAFRLEYSETTFAFARALFAGDFLSSTGDCTSGALTVQVPAQNSQSTFNTDANTVYLTRGRASTCAAVTGGYAAGEPILVWAGEFTDGSWYAARVNANPRRAPRQPGKNKTVVLGMICSYTAGQSMTVSMSCGSGSDFTLSFGRRLRLTYEGTTSPAPNPVAGDWAAVFVRTVNGQPVAYGLEYGEDPFVVSTLRVEGTYASSTGDCTSGTVTVNATSPQTETATFNTDANTIYLTHRRASTCAAVTGAYSAGQQLRLRVTVSSDAVMYATTIDARGGGQGGPAA